MNLDRFKAPDNEPPIHREPDNEPRDDEHYRQLLNQRCQENVELLKSVWTIQQAQIRDRELALAKSLNVLLELTQKALEK